MSIINDGGQAFPTFCPVQNNQPDKYTYIGGMTLRDYFAAKAMPAIYTEVVRRASDEGWPEDWRDGIAQDAYKMADAMLKAREAKS